MPKGKGASGVGAIGEALRVDIESLPAQTEAKAKQGQERIRRINITITEEVLKAADTEVFNRKQAGKSSSRSGLIDQALRKYLGIK